MKIKMLVGLAGGLNLSPGDEHDFDEAEAIRHIEAGHAIPVADKPKTEKAVKKGPAETR